MCKYCEVEFEYDNGMVDYFGEYVVNKTYPADELYPRALTLEVNVMGDSEEPIICYDLYDKDEDFQFIMESFKINYCPMCGRKLIRD